MGLWPEVLITSQNLRDQKHYTYARQTQCRNTQWSLSDICSFSLMTLQRQRPLNLMSLPMALLCLLPWDSRAPWDTSKAHQIIEYSKLLNLLPPPFFSTPRNTHIYPSIDVPREPFPAARTPPKTFSSQQAQSITVLKIQNPEMSQRKHICEGALKTIIY